MGYLLVAAIVAFTAGCGERRGDASNSGSSRGAGSADRSSSEIAAGDKDGEPLILLAAASTKDAVEELAASFEKQTGTRVRVSAGPSNALATQITAGAPADLFLSANEKWAAHISEQGLAEEVTPLLTNGLVLIVPRDNPAQVKSPSDLAGQGVKRVALAGENVPAGIYAEQALRELAIYDLLIGANKIVRGQDLRFTLSYVARGEADAGIF
jgi:molybdate transport system substrate-binding protein